MRDELAERRTARVNIDYHVQHDGRLYSLRYQLVHEEVEVRATGSVTAEPRRP